MRLHVNINHFGTCIAIVKLNAMDQTTCHYLQEHSIITI